MNEARMDFGQILEEWEKNEKISSNVESIMEEWLDVHPALEKTDSSESRDKKREAALRRKRLREMAPEAEIDLHGFTVSEAVPALDLFIKECKQKGMKKILIIHGKGNHSRGEPILKKEVRSFIEKCPSAGEYGVPDRYSGGSGALWVVLR